MDIRSTLATTTRRRRPGRRPPRPVTPRAEALAVGLGCQVAPPRRPPSSRRP